MLNILKQARILLTIFTISTSSSNKAWSYRSKLDGGRLIPAIMALSLFIGCSSPAPPSIPTPPPLANELLLYNWEDDLPQSVLDAFTKEYGVKVIYHTYEVQEEAIANLKAGRLYDVVVFDNDRMAKLITEGLLAEIDYQNVPNIRNISANFRDLAYDPGNKHSVPYNWGTSGLVIRSDLIDEPPTHWADLWQPRYAGQVAMRNESREALGIALKALGYSINSENPAELEAALAHLLKAKPLFSLVDETAEGAVPHLLKGDFSILVGWAEDVLLAREENEHITYILPEDGPMLWGDNFVIPANSPHKYTAELFLNFVLRAEINAMLVNENYYATANQAATPFIDSEIRANPLIFPPNEKLVKAEVFLPLSPAGEKLYQEIWDRFLAAAQTE